MLASAWKGATLSLGYLKSVHNSEQFGATIRFRSAHLSMIVWGSLDLVLGSPVLNERSQAGVTPIE